ncbi:hypothetical protein BRADI_4g09236v3 [Brachypodium distachyon]|uniref:Membrane protein insertion efficiency factor YidD n=1 Tax=Brachypodium distachyon TaxID=15368 RepID=A0A0Q3ILC9_BRADI|nr:hypothetical protein BRADI_4g09236v3 [Brachypodium distachyon]
MHSHNAAMAMDAAVSVSLFPTMAGHPLARRTKKVDDLGVKVALSMLRFYKREISPLLPSSCCYVPTCSEYSMQAYKRCQLSQKVSYLIMQLHKGGYSAALLLVIVSRECIY